MSRETGRLVLYKSTCLVLYGGSRPKLRVEIVLHPDFIGCHAPQAAQKVQLVGFAERRIAKSHFFARALNEKDTRARLLLTIINQLCNELINELL